MIRLYIRNVLVGLDKFINAVFGGDPNETMSSRVFRYKDVNAVAKTAYIILDKIETNHCETSLEPDDHHKDEVLK